MSSTRPAEAGEPVKVPAWVVWGCPLATAGLLYLAFFPAAVGMLGWFALVPLLVLVKLPGRPKHLYLSCWVSALLLHWGVLQWVRVADVMMYAAWGLLATYGSLYWPIALALLRWLDRRTALPLTLTVPAVWVSYEYVRYGLAGCFVSLLTGSHQHDVPGGFAWYLLGHTQHDFLEVIQVADLAGAYGVTFLVTAVNALLLEMLARREWFRRVFLGVGRAFQPDSSPLEGPTLREGAESLAVQAAPSLTVGPLSALPPGRPLDGGAKGQAEMPGRRGKVALLLQGIAVMTLLLAALAYGRWRIGQPIDHIGPKLAIMQTNVPQARRNDTAALDAERRDEARREIAADFALLANHAARQKADLIVTPETSYPGTWVEHYPGKPIKHSQELADTMAARLRTPVLVGMSADVLDPQGTKRAYNSSILIGRDGRWLGRYDKIHRVPFGEYIPFHQSLPFLAWFAPYEDEYSVGPGTAFTRFPLAAGGEYHFGVMICYEDTDPAMTRPYGGGGKAQTDFLLNVSNDGWFHGTSEHDQHLAICRFRAVECRRSVGRSVNVGISAIIDPNGRVLAPELVEERGGVRIWQIPEEAGSLPVSRWHEYKQVGGILVGRVPIDRRESFYARHGDWFAGSWLALVTLVCVGMFVTRRKTP